MNPFKRLETYPSIQDGNIDAAEIETMLRTNPAVDKAEIDEFLKSFANRWTKMGTCCWKKRFSVIIVTLLTFQTEKEVFYLLIVSVQVI